MLKRYFSTKSPGGRLNGPPRERRIKDEKKYRTYFDCARYDWFKTFLKWTHG